MGSSSDDLCGGACILGGPGDHHDACTCTSSCADHHDACTCTSSCADYHDACTCTSIHCGSTHDLCGGACILGGPGSNDICSTPCLLGSSGDDLCGGACIFGCSGLLSRACLHGGTSLRR